MHYGAASGKHPLKPALRFLSRIPRKKTRIPIIAVQRTQREFGSLEFGLRGFEVCRSLSAVRVASYGAINATAPNLNSLRPLGSLRLCGESVPLPGSEFGVRSLAFAGRCGWRHTALANAMTPNLIPFRTLCSLHLCGESPSRPQWTRRSRAS